MSAPGRLETGEVITLALLLIGSAESLAPALRRMGRGDVRDDVARSRLRDRQIAQCTVCGFWFNSGNAPRKQPYVCAGCKPEVAYEKSAMEE